MDNCASQSSYSVQQKVSAMIKPSNKLFYTFFLDRIFPLTEKFLRRVNVVVGGALTGRNVTLSRRWEKRNKN